MRHIVWLFALLIIVGCKDKSSSKSPVDSPQVSVPAHPTGMSARYVPSSPGPGDSVQAIINWNSVPGATSYKVYLNLGFTSPDDVPAFRNQERADGSCSVSGADITTTTTSTTYTHSFTTPNLPFFRGTYLHGDVQACNSSGCSCNPGLFARVLPGRRSVSHGVDYNQ